MSRISCSSSCTNEIYFNGLCALNACIYLNRVRPAHGTHSIGKYFHFLFGCVYSMPGTERSLAWPKRFIGNRQASHMCALTISKWTRMLCACKLFCWECNNISNLNNKCLLSSCSSIRHCSWIDLFELPQRNKSLEKLSSYSKMHIGNVNLFENPPDQIQRNFIDMDELMMHIAYTKIFKWTVFSTFTQQQ